MLKRNLLILGLIGAVLAASVYWFHENPPGVTMVDPARLPENILEPAEVEKIRTLQNINDVFLNAPITQRNGLPALWAHGVADLLVILPFIYGLLFYQGYKRNRRLSLDGVVLFREGIFWWQYPVFVPVVLLSAAIVPLLEPVSNFIFDKLFSWWPPMYELSLDLRSYPQSIIAASLLFNFLIIGLLVPIAEEIYFRGYLLPRLSRFGFWAAPIHAVLFALFHVWTPWMVVARAIAVIPFAYVIQRKRNIYIGIIMHIIINTLDVLTGLMLILVL